MRARETRAFSVRLAIGLIGLALLVGPSLAAGEPVHHDLTVVLSPNAGELTVDVTITVPKGLARHDGVYSFALHRGWEPTTRDRGVGISRRQHPSAGQGDGYAISLPPGQRTFSLSYVGRVNQPSGSTNAGDDGDALTQEAVVLSRESLWYPILGDELVTFTLTVRAPVGWEIISQGKRVLHRRDRDYVEVRWASPEPQDDIYVVGGPLTEYTRQAGEITAMAFLRTPDPELAKTYLEATERYLSMYSALLGPYPYSKFAMVENAWETGYGMPSFTLLGSTVIRLPFILHSSYPHEILHNWWGNGVFVDASRGNWAEGLTAYLADHLLAEQRGSGAEYRRAALQQYADYVTHDRDFPIVDFTARHSPATQAVGYGKALMVFHMIRRDLGDDVFLRALRGFFDQFRFRRATFMDLDRAFAEAAGRQAGGLPAWIEKPGAPALKISNAEALPLGDRYLLEALVEQTQPGAAYRLRVPVAVTLEGREQAYQTTFDLRTKHRGLELAVPGRPLRFDVDPEFDLFRRLDRAELPPSLSHLFGATRIMVILPSAAPPALRDGYRLLAESLVRSTESHQIVFDQAVDRLPTDRSVWILGWENRWMSAITEETSGLPVTMDDRFARLAGTELTRERHAVVIAGRQARALDLGVGWLGCDQLAALAGLARKLPHYGKYGYLGFEGPEPTNMVKGEWPVVHSPLSILVKQPDGSIVDVPRAALAPRRALAEGTDSRRARLRAMASLARPSPTIEIEAGWFLMGSPQLAPTMGLRTPYDDTEIPQRRIWLEHYVIDREEVSVANYLRWIVDHRGGTLPDLQWFDRATANDAVRAGASPVVSVTWYEAVEYCRSMGQRLPTEAEWEKAARGVDGRLFPWGDDPPDQHRAVFGRSPTVGELPVVGIGTLEAGRSPYGILHAAGNAAEWVADWSGIDWYRVMPERNPQGPLSGRYKVVRGGSWRSDPVMLRTATRSAASPDVRRDTIGFRCAAAP